MNPEEFLIAFLEEFLLARFADPQSGNAKPFLLSFTFKDYGKAEHLADWITNRLTVPGSRESLEVEIFELPEGGFKVRAALIGDGSMYKLSD